MQGDCIKINWPYPILVHHYIQLATFRETYAAKHPSDLCLRERDAEKHLGLMLKSLDDHVMPALRAEQERNRKGYYTWEHLWLLYKPGTTFMGKIWEDSDWHSYVVKSISGGTFVDPPSPWIIDRWSMTFDRKYLGRTNTISKQYRFDGELASGGHVIVVDSEKLSADDIESLGEIVIKQQEYGKRYWNLITQQCKYYKGKRREFPHNRVLALKDMLVHAYLLIS